MKMQQVIFYTKQNCPLCEDAKAFLMLLRGDYPFGLDERDIYTNDEWLEKYQLMIPVAEVNGQQLDCEQINYESLERLLAGNR